MKARNKGVPFQRHEQPKTIRSLLFAVVPVVVYKVERISCAFCHLLVPRTKCAVSWVLRSSEGSMLMEYVLLQVCVACFLMLMMNNLFYNWSSGSLVGLGLEVKYFFQRLLGGLSLPVP